MSLYPTYDRRLMEVVRILSVEEILCLAHDVAYCLTEDRIRDLGPSRAIGAADSIPIRPGWISMRALDHALRSAGFDVPGFQSHEDLEEAFGPEVAADMTEGQFKVEQYMSGLGAIMEEFDCNMKVAIIIDAARSRNEIINSVEDLDIPDDLSGFGWEE